MFYFFDKSENVLEAVPRARVETAVYTNELSGKREIQISLPTSNYRDIYDVHLETLQTVSDNYYDLIGSAVYVGFREGTTRFQLFKLDSAKVSGDKISWNGLHVFFDDLSACSIIRSNKVLKKSAAEALAQAVLYSRWVVGTVDIPAWDIGSVYFFYDTPLQAIQKVIEKFGGEIDYYLTFNGNSITGRYVDLKLQLGEDSGERIVYGKNAIEILYEEDSSNIVTALIGRGKGVEREIIDTSEPPDISTVAGMSAEMDTWYDKKIDFSGIAWSVAEGYAVDKPLGVDYVTIPERTAAFGYPNGEPRFGVVEFSEYEEGQESELLKATYNKLLELSRPKLALRVSAIAIGERKVGDRVNIIRNDINLYYQARVRKMTKNLLVDGEISYEVGDYIDYGKDTSSKSLSRQIEITNRKVNKANAEIKRNIAILQQP